MGRAPLLDSTGRDEGQRGMCGWVVGWSKMVRV